MVAEYRVCPAGEGALGTQEREAFSPHPSQFEVAAAAVQGPDVGIGMTVEIGRASCRERVFVGV